MKLRGQIYPKYTDSLPYECRGIGQVCDMATGRVGEPVPMGPRKPICRIDGHNFTDALLYPIEVHQMHEPSGNPGETKDFSELIVRQEPTANTSADVNIDFLTRFNSLYSRILNDVRMLYKDYIATGFTQVLIGKPTLIEQIKEREISTKDLIKLKFFHLMNYFTFIIINKNTPGSKN